MPTHTFILSTFYYVRITIQKYFILSKKPFSPTAMTWSSQGKGFPCAAQTPLHTCSPQRALHCHRGGAGERKSGGGAQESWVRMSQEMSNSRTSWAGQPEHLRNAVDAGGGSG